MTKMMKFVVVYLALVFFIPQALVTGLSNGKAPVFENDWFWEIEENAPVSSRPHFTILPKDPVVLEAYDRGGQTLTFEVGGGVEQSYFTVDAHTGVVKLRKPFDRELMNTYTARFIVSNGFDLSFGEANVTIVDVNDNAPLFDRIRYEVTIRENSPIGSEVLRVSASDPDSGHNGEIVYRLSQKDSRVPFYINPASGVVSLSDNIDYETTSKYRFVVVSRDSNIDRPLSSTAIVTVNIADVQDTPPVFDQTSYDARIDENTPARTVIVTVKAQDGDRGDPNEITYSLVAGKEYGIFSLDTSNGKISYFGNLDRERPGFDGVYFLTVRATEQQADGSIGGAFSETHFQIKVNDLNDNRPQFTQAFYQLSLPESTPVGTRLPLSIYVADADQDYNSDVTMAVEWRYSQLMTVSPVTFRGEANVSLILTKPLDFETKQMHSFQLYANETSNPSLYTTCNIQIDVINENDNEPIFTQAHYRVNISENASENKPITQVRAGDLDQGSFGEIVYSVQDGNNEIHVDEDTGDVYLLKELDYEESKRKQYVLKARDLAPSPLEATALLTIYVLDENDNPPVFSQKFPNISVRENIIMKGLTMIWATDADSFPNNVLTYSIVSGLYSNHFSILPTDDGGGVINVKEPFDYDSMNPDIIELSIKVEDQDHLYSIAPLVVRILDVNDIAPVFEPTSNITIDENVTGGVPVGRIRAMDGDSGKNGQVYYYVTGGQDLFGTVFQLNEATGDITTKPGASPDYEVTPFFDITVTAQDGGIPPLRASQSLRVSIQDVNDNAPLFNIPTYRVSIDENSSLDLFTAHASDADTGVNADLRYSIVDGDRGVFQINKISGLISAKKQIDFEELGEEVVLQVMAEDMGSDIQLHSIVNVFVTINDINDNSPIFRQVNPTNLQVDENKLTPSLGNFQADDLDTGANAKLRYSIIKGNELDHFDFSPQDGELRVTHGVTLDREEVDAYTLTLSVTDGGIPQRTSTTTIWIEVLDANDNSPQFIEFPMHLHVIENSVTASITHLRAFDPDIGPNGLVTFSMEENEETNNAFYLNPATGVIDLVRPLDREKQSAYNLTVVAKDNPENIKDSKFAKATIQITIGDVNDEKPEFLSSIPYRATIDEGLPSGTVLTYTSTPPSAMDHDLGENSKVTYSIIGSGSSYFSVDSETGTLYTTTNIDRETLSSDVVNVILRASDVGGLYSETILKVTVTDVNDNDPTFVQLQSPVHVSESVLPGDVITRMNASDLDLGSNGEVWYRIANGSFGKFSINTKTGVITLAPGEYLDRESQSRYQLSIVASDKGISEMRSSTAEVIVLVDDVNDSRPKFPSSFQKITIHENSAVESTIATLSATDDDLHPILTYHMTSVTIYDSDKRPLVVDQSPEDVLQTDYRQVLMWFQLDSTTGKIKLSSSSEQDRTTLDREAASSVHLTFAVRDETSFDDEISTSLNSMTLQVEIVDQNDNSPTFEILTPHVTLRHNDVIVDVLEEGVIGTKLISVLGRDEDQGNNGKILFELLGDVNSLLRLKSQNSGTIVASNRIDREALAPTGGHGWINVTLLARDLGSSIQRLSKLTVRMRIKDINDNSPVFLQPSYESSLFENVEADTVAIRVKATDSDIGDYGNITYRLIDTGGFFAVDTFTGVVSVARPLDRESNSQHTFTVIAEDCLRARSEYKDASAQVTINVIDVNDNSPKFTHPLQTSFSILENINPGTTITTVGATDLDLGEYGLVTYSCQSTADYFAIDRYSGDVTILRPVTVSRRHPTEVLLNVTATDGGGLKTTLVLQINVEDVNDHFPVIISPKSSIFRIPEEEPAGHLVAQFNASDDDMGLNGVVRYRLAESDAMIDDVFYVDDVTGKVVTSRKLDRESQQSYRLVLEAFDLGDPSLHSSKVITVHLNDINDNQPTFPQNDAKGAFQQIEVYENHIPGTVVGDVTKALDRDEHPKIYYHVISENGHRNQRTFDMDRHKIILRKNIDREKIDSYMLLIQATNSKKFHQSTTRNRHSRWRNPTQERNSYLSFSTPKLFLAPNPSTDPSLLRLSIKVLDFIDEPPIFKRHHYVIPVEDGTRSFTQLAQIKVTDKDVDDIITYTILRSTYIRSDNASLQRMDFVIHSTTGSLSTATIIRGPGSRYILTIQAKDISNLTDKTNITIMVMKGSQQFKFVIDSPPEVVREQQNNLTDFLKNLTNSFVLIDDVSNHLTSANKIDVTRSDVITRVFDSALGKDEIDRKLASGGTKLNGMFKSYFFRNLPDDERVGRNSEETALRVAVVILSLILILLLLISAIIIIHMRRRYKEAINNLQAVDSPDDVTMTSKSDFWKQPKPEDTSRPSHKKQEETSTAASKQHGKGLYVQDCSPVAASSLLWTPSAPRRKATENPAEGNKEKTKFILTSLFLSKHKSSNGSK